MQPTFTRLRSFQRGRPSHVIKTLDPNKFAEKQQQHLYIYNQHSFTPYIPLNKQSTPVKTLPLFYDSESPLAYPYIKPFLYYFTPPDKPRIAAELRLRITPSIDPASFESGYDLLKVDGQPWSRPLFMLPKLYIRLYEKLREDQLVPDDLDAVLSTFTSIAPKFRRSQFLYTFDDTFIVDFSCYQQDLYAITEQGMEMVRIMAIFCDRRLGVRTMPYTGTFTIHQLLDTPR
jgi:hypothetical protein